MLIFNSFNKVSSCENAKEIWHILEDLWETKQVKDFKINLLIHQYKVFKMDQMRPLWTCSLGILTLLMVVFLGNEYSTNELVNKSLC